MSRNRLILFGAVGLVVLVVLTFPLWSPLFRNDVVDEAFPSLSAEQRDAVRNMPRDQQDVLMAMSKDNAQMAADTVSAMMEADTAMDEAMPEMPAEPAVVSQGSFIAIDAVHKAEGSATIYDVDGQQVLRFENFSVTNGPDLHVILSKITPTDTFGGVGDDMIDLGKLKGNIGNQNYDIPAEVDLSQYQSVVIYCVPFGVVFSSAGLINAPA
ncbi:MAG: DM13 domain-containing protein [Anaerolineae bacterium]